VAKNQEAGGENKIRECLFYRLKNPQLKAEIEKKISGESNGASDGAGGGQASQNQ